MARSSLVCGTLLLLCNGVAPAEEPSAPSSVPAGIVDHHVHVLGPDLVRDWKSLGVPFTKPDETYLSATRLLAPAANGAAAPLGAAVLVPMAHFYGNIELRTALQLPLAEEHRRVSNENDHVAREAARYPGRAVALCAVDYLRPYAWEELRRCRSELGSPGIKIHLGSAGADLADAAHLDRLEEIVAWVVSERIALLLHFDPQRRGLERSDVERFVARVLAPHPTLELQIAHLGGSGGFDAWTRTILGALRDWLAAEAARGVPRPGVRFDLSAVLLAQASEGVPASTPEEAAALADALRAIAPDRLLFASDAPVFDPVAHAALLAERLGLDREELARLVSRRSPMLPRRGASEPVAPANLASPAGGPGRCETNERCEARHDPCSVRKPLRAWPFARRPRSG